MANAMFDFITESARARDNNEVLACLDYRSQVLRHGLLCAIFGIPLPSERIDPYFMLNAWPDGWFERYVQENYVHVDP